MVLNECYSMFMVTDQNIAFRDKAVLKQRFFHAFLITHLKITASSAELSFRMVVNNIQRHTHVTIRMLPFWELATRG